MLNRLHYESEQKNTAFFFNAIYQSACKLAENKEDKDAATVLANILMQGVKIDVVHNGFSPISLLAKEGKDAAVNILLNNYQANLNDALEGYAISGRTDKVYEFNYKKIVRKENLHGFSIAVCGAARGGHKALANELIELNTKYAYILDTGHHSKLDLLNAAALGYAYVNDAEGIKQVLDQGASLEFVLEGYARAGNAKWIKDYLQLQGAHDHHLDAIRDSIVRGYTAAGHVDKCVKNGDTTLLYLFAICDDDIRDDLLKAFEDSDLINQINDKPKTSTGLFVELVTQLKSLMKQYQISFKDAYRVYLFKTQYQLDFDQAHAWLSPALRIWFLEGVKNLNLDLDQNGSMLPEVYFYIASFLGTLQDKDTYQLFDTMHFGENKRVLVNHLGDIVNAELAEAKAKGSNFATHSNLFAAVKNTKTKEALNDLLDSQNQDQFYQDHLASVHVRLKQ